MGVIPAGPIVCVTSFLSDKLTDPFVDDLVQQVETLLTSTIEGVGAWELVLVLALSAITVYRRELSSNRVYNKPPQGSDERTGRSMSLPSDFNRFYDSIADSSWCTGILKAVPPAKKVSLPLPLPVELLNECLSYLTAAELLNVAQTSRSMQISADADVVWSGFWKRRFLPIWQSPAVQACAKRSHCHWNPAVHRPPQGWKVFTFQFELSWIDWVAAGCNLEPTTVHADGAAPNNENPVNASVLVGIEGSLYDVTAFVLDHPGSPDVLLDSAGRDATEMFDDIGHSTGARRAMAAFRVVQGPTGDKVVPTCIRKRYQQLKTSTIPLLAIAATAATSVLRANTAESTNPVDGNEIQVSSNSGLAGEESSSVPASFADDHHYCKKCCSEYDPSEGRKKAGCRHVAGAPRVVFLPVTNEWTYWWSCCRTFGPVLKL